MELLLPERDYVCFCCIFPVCVLVKHVCIFVAVLSGENRRHPPVGLHGCGCVQRLRQLRRSSASQYQTSAHGCVGKQRWTKYTIVE